MDSKKDWTRHYLGPRFLSEFSKFYDQSNVIQLHVQFTLVARASFQSNLFSDWSRSRQTIKKKKSKVNSTQIRIVNICSKANKREVLVNGTWKEEIKKGIFAPSSYISFSMCASALSHKASTSFSSIFNASLHSSIASLGLSSWKSRQRKTKLKEENVFKLALSEHFSTTIRS